MIVHVIDVIEGGPAGLIAVLAAHAQQRSLDVEAGGLDAETLCQVEECQRLAGWLAAVHRRHSRREREDLVLCQSHLEAHRAGADLRIRVESNR